MKKLLGLCCLLLLAPAFAETDTHPKVQEALDWQLPENDCKKPALLATAANVSDGVDYAQSDTDTYTIKRYERKKKRWESCVKKYKKRLMNDFETLKDSAQHGLTKPQADTILAKMGFIQSVYMTEDGLPPAGTELAGAETE